ncbi:unnamed protein product [Arctogadus glacialis]
MDLFPASYEVSQRRVGPRRGSGTPAGRVLLQKRRQTRDGSVPRERRDWGGLVGWGEQEGRWKRTQGRPSGSPFLPTAL